MRILLKNPGELPVLADPVELEDFQALVGGYVEVVRLARGVQILVNEDGLALDLPISAGGLRGPLVFVGVVALPGGDEEWRGLVDEELRKAQAWLAKHDLDPALPARAAGAFRIVEDFEREGWLAQARANARWLQADWDSL